MVQPVFFNIAKPVWDKLTAEQKKVVETAAKNAQKFNDDSRLNDEKKVTDAIKAKGLQVDAIDLGPFRAQADKTYAEAPAAKAWDAALMKRVLDTK
jgi:TRAP-type C4-dicarboxylate transport system substrate-binding protein